ncbi:hypothetical protein Csa_015484 [Cucumis sativus]|uniref:Uncharacterized protein n=1 Tax=Cucumis sativus TaxID=3659 RepID=A0A0A0K338_CUCSA|nr:hypothetical protein Csa_015484 [Cucumis sativus]
MKAKVSGDNSCERGSSAMRIPNVPPLSPLDHHLEGLVDVDSDESLTGPHMADTTIEKVGILKTPAAKPVELSLHLSALLEKIR